MKTDKEWFEIAHKMAIELHKLPVAFDLKEKTDKQYALKLINKILTDGRKQGYTEAAQEVTNAGGDNEDYHVKAILNARDQIK